MKVRFVTSKTEDEYLSLTDGKVYEVEETIDWPPSGGKRYMLVEDDDDEQVPYDTDIFEVVEDGE